jgi:hypothetical protein
MSTADQGRGRGRRVVEALINGRSCVAGKGVEGGGVVDYRNRPLGAGCLVLKPQEKPKPSIHSGQ